MSGLNENEFDISSQKGVVRRSDAQDLANLRQRIDAERQYQALNDDDTYFNSGIGNSIYDDEVEGLTQTTYDFVNNEDYRNKVINEIRAENQGVVGDMGASLLHMAGRTASTFAEGTVGLLYNTISGIDSAIKGDGFKKGFIDNAFSNAISDFDKAIEELAPLYKTQAEQEGLEFNLSHWIGENIISNMGFTAGAIMSGGVLARTLGALQKVAMGAKVGYGVEGAAERLATQAGRIANGERMGAIDVIKDKIRDGAINASVNVASGLNEATIEAINGGKDFYNTAVSKMNAQLSEETNRLKNKAAMNKIQVDALFEKLGKLGEESFNLIGKDDQASISKQAQINNEIAEIENQIKNLNADTKACEDRYNELKVNYEIGLVRLEKETQNMQVAIWDANKDLLIGKNLILGSEFGNMAKIVARNGGASASGIAARSAANTNTSWFSNTWRGSSNKIKNFFKKDNGINTLDDKFIENGVAKKWTTGKKVGEMAKFAMKQTLDEGFLEEYPQNFFAEANANYAMARMDNFNKALANKDMAIDKEISYWEYIADQAKEYTGNAKNLDAVLIAGITSTAGTPTLRKPWKKSADGKTKFQIPVEWSGGIKEAWKDLNNNIKAAQQIENRFNKYKDYDLLGKTGKQYETLSHAIALNKNNELAFRDAEGSKVISGDNGLDIEDSLFDEEMFTAAAYADAGREEEYIAKINNTFDTSSEEATVRSINNLAKATTKTLEGGGVVNCFTDENGVDMRTTKDGMEKCAKIVKQLNTQYKKRAQAFFTTRREIHEATNGTMSTEHEQLITWSALQSYRENEKMYQIQKELMSIYAKKDGNGIIIRKNAKDPDKEEIIEDPFYEIEEAMKEKRESLEQEKAKIQSSVPEGSVISEENQKKIDEINDNISVLDSDKKKLDRAKQMQERYSEEGVLGNNFGMDFSTLLGGEINEHAEHAFMKRFAEKLSNIDAMNKLTARLDALEEEKKNNGGKVNTNDKIEELKKEIDELKKKISKADKQALKTKSETAIKNLEDRVKEFNKNKKDVLKTIEKMRKDFIRSNHVNGGKMNHLPNDVRAKVLTRAVVDKLTASGITVHLEDNISGDVDGADNLNGKQTSNPTIEYLRDSDGVVYGYVKDGEIYLNKSALNPEAAVHEYTHLWLAAIKEQNKELYDEICRVVSRTEEYKNLQTEEAYKDLSVEGRISEAFSRIVANKGLKNIVDRKAKLSTLESIASKVATWLKGIFGSKKNDYLFDLPVIDLVNGVSIKDLNAVNKDINDTIKANKEYNKQIKENSNNKAKISNLEIELKKEEEEKEAIEKQIKENEEAIEDTKKKLMILNSQKQILESYDGFFKGLFKRRDAAKKIRTELKREGWSVLKSIKRGDNALTKLLRWTLNKIPLVNIESDDELKRLGDQAFEARINSEFGGSSLFDILMLKNLPEYKQKLMDSDPEKLTADNILLQFLLVEARNSRVQMDIFNNITSLYMNNSAVRDEALRRNTAEFYRKKYKKEIEAFENEILKNGDPNDIDSFNKIIDTIIPESNLKSRYAKAKILKAIAGGYVKCSNKTQGLANQALFGFKVVESEEYKNAVVKVYNDKEIEDGDRVIIESLVKEAIKQSKNKSELLRSLKGYSNPGMFEKAKEYIKKAVGKEVELTDLQRKGVGYFVAELEAWDDTEFEEEVDKKIEEEKEVQEAKNKKLLELSTIFSDDETNEEKEEPIEVHSAVEVSETSGEEADSSEEETSGDEEETEAKESIEVHDLGDGKSSVVRSVPKKKNKETGEVTQQAFTQQIVIDSEDANLIKQKADSGDVDGAANDFKSHFDFLSNEINEDSIYDSVRKKTTEKIKAILDKIEYSDESEIDDIISNYSLLSVEKKKVVVDIIKNVYNERLEEDNEEDGKEDEIQNYSSNANIVGNSFYTLHDILKLINDKKLESVDLHKIIGGDKATVDRLISRLKSIEYFVNHGGLDALGDIDDIEVKYMYDPTMEFDSISPDNLNKMDKTPLWQVIEIKDEKALINNGFATESDSIVEINGKKYQIIGSLSFRADDNSGIAKNCGRLKAMAKTQVYKDDVSDGSEPKPTIIRSYRGAKKDIVTHINTILPGRIATTDANNDTPTQRPLNTLTTDTSNLIFGISYGDHEALISKKAPAYSMYIKPSYTSKGSVRLYVKTADGRYRSINVRVARLSDPELVNNGFINSELYKEIRGYVETLCNTNASDIDRTIAKRKLSKIIHFGEKVKETNGIKERYYKIAFNKSGVKLEGYKEEKGGYVSIDGTHTSNADEFMRTLMSDQFKFRLQMNVFDINSPDNESKEKIKKLVDSGAVTTDAISLNYYCPEIVVNDIDMSDTATDDSFGTEITERKPDSSHTGDDTINNTIVSKHLKDVTCISGSTEKKSDFQLDYENGKLIAIYSVSGGRRTELPKDHKIYRAIEKLSSIVDGTVELSYVVYGNNMSRRSIVATNMQGEEFVVTNTNNSYTVDITNNSLNTLKQQKTLLNDVKTRIEAFNNISQGSVSIDADSVSINENTEGKIAVQFNAVYERAEGSYQETVGGLTVTFQGDSNESSKKTKSKIQCTIDSDGVLSVANNVTAATNQIIPMSVLSGLSNTFKIAWGNNNTPDVNGYKKEIFAPLEVNGQSHGLRYTKQSKVRSDLASANTGEEIVKTIKDNLDDQDINKLINDIKSKIGDNLIFSTEEEMYRFIGTMIKMNDDHITFDNIQKLSIENFKIIVDQVLC